jgi:hypothetical protein
MLLESLKEVCFYVVMLNVVMNPEYIHLLPLVHLIWVSLITNPNYY